MKTVLCHGCFDILHAGHLAYFEAARALGDRLIVSVTSDRYVNKGPGRPYFDAELRARMVASQRCVDEVWISDHLTAVQAIERFKPNVYVKGKDYVAKSGDIETERSAVELHGGRLVFTDTPLYSSSTLINRFLSRRTDEQEAAIARVRDAGGMRACADALEAISKLSVHIVGEHINDVYRFVSGEGISSKHACLSTRFIREESYCGGTLAIQRLLSEFVSDTEVTLGATSTKTRYITEQGQRLFEETTIAEHHPLPEFSTDTDLFILADFGHGFFERAMLERCTKLKPFVALNVQTNSSNYGFNLFTKHKQFDYLVIDTREARLGVQDRYSDPLSVASKVHERIDRRAMALTAGPNGAYLFKDGIHHCPAFTDTVVDAIGAGDVYFALTACLLRIGCEPTITNFLGNVAAGLKTQILGHSASVTKDSLIRACDAILK